MTSDIAAWLLAPSTADLDAAPLLDGLVVRLGEAGLSLRRASVWIPTKHPELWGHQLIWSPAEGARVLRRSHEVSSTVDYVGTPAEALHASGAASLRCWLDREPDRGRFAMLAGFAASGATDYLMTSLEPAGDRGAWISYTTAAPGGFSDAQVERLESLAPLLALHVRLAAARLDTRSLLEVYLGTNASAHVLRGDFRRGTGRELDAALWFCDMRGFTSIGDRLPARSVVELLDGYFEAVAGPVEEEGGEILKLIGDAALAVFPIESVGASDACRRALAAGEAVLEGVDRWSSGVGEPIALGVALHVGRVMYGNVGGRARLDFTVIGASVNEVCRIEAMCKPLGQPLLFTAEVAAGLDRPDVVSLGEHPLKGVSRPRELFTVRRGAG